MTSAEIYESNLKYFKIKKRYGDKTQAYCSAHGDGCASLTITKGRKCTLFYCHAGCTVDEVLAAAGLEKKDTFYDVGPRSSNWRAYIEGREKRRIEAVYNYVSINGGYAFTKVRIQGKKMIYGMLVNERFTYGLGGQARKELCAVYAPNGVQAINKAISEDKPIFIPEGEKDADTLAKQGYTAFSYGGVNDWAADMAQLCKGAVVYVLADNDEPGRRIANIIQHDLQGIAKSAKVIVPVPDTPKADISDYFAAGHSAAEFEQMLQQEQNTVTEAVKGVKEHETPNLNIGLDAEVDYTPFLLYNDNGKITGINHNAIAEDIKAKHSLFVSGCFYESDRGYYKPDVTGAKIKGYIKQRIKSEMRKSQVINQIYNLLHDDFSIERNFNDTNIYPARWVPFNDYLLDPLTWEEIAYKDEFYCVNRLPYNWKDCKGATDGKEIEKYLDFAIPDVQDREMALEYDGLSCNRDTSFQKAMLYVGQGGSGKSIKLRMSQTILGAENYSNVGLFDLGKRFMPGLLLGKLANICSDLPIKALSDEANEALKLIVGEDMIFHETKGQNGFFFTPYCKMTFSTNMLPQVLDERNNAVFRRLLILRMDNTPENPDATLFSKLEKELPYYIKLMMEALHRLYERGYIFESENSKKEIEQMRRDSDTTEDFLATCCTKKTGARVDRGKLFTRYEKHCEDECRQSLSKNAFNKAIRAKGFKQVKSCGYWYFEGISLEKLSLDSPSTDKESSLSGVEVDANGFIKVSEEALKDLPFT